MAALGAVTVHSGGRTYRCHHGRKARKRLFCACLKKKGAKKRAQRTGAAKKKRGVYGAARTAQLRKAYGARARAAFGPGMVAPRRRGSCKDARGRSGMWNKEGQCKTPKKR